MKQHTITKLLATTAITFGSLSLISQPSQAQNTSFYCGMCNGVPTTFADTPRGTVPVIRWVSQHFSGSGYTPQQRCEEVSGRFQTYYNQGILNYVTTGYMNRMPVVCVSSTNGGECTGLLYTLKPGQNASRTLQQLFDIRQGAAGPLYEDSSGGGTTEKVYIDINNYLETAEVESDSTNPNVTTPEPVETPNVTTPNNETPPNNNNSGGGLW